MLSHRFIEWSLPCWENGVLLASGIPFGVLVMLTVRSFAGRHPSPVPEGLFTTSPPPGDALRQGAAGGRSGRERRRLERRRGGNVTVQIADAEGNYKPYQGWVVDRSAGGLCLSVAGALPADATLRVRPGDVWGLVPWVTVKVRYCRKIGAFWQAGCQYAPPPMPSMLLLFG